MDIQASIKDDGSVDIEQTLTYKFDGQYNGIYITIPYNKAGEQYKDIVKNNRINDDLYTGSRVSNISVSEVQSSQESIYQRTVYGKNGQDGVYEIETESKKQKIKVYSP